MHDVERLAAMFTALGNRARLDLIDAMVKAGSRPDRADCGMTISELATRTEISRFSASRHLTILRECSLVRGVSSGSRTLHYLNSDTLDDIDDWLFPLLMKRDAGSDLSTA